MNKRDALTDKALAAVRREKMICPGDTILVGLSGGADSMALLYFLIDRREALGIGQLMAAHVNHGLRGEEAARDEAFVREQCDKRGVSLFVYTADVAGEAAAGGEGLEEAGRRVRYAFLTERAALLKARIATAHTLSDSMETVLFHMTRGCGLHGLSGIPPVRAYSGDSFGTIIRPLIDCSRADVEAYCADHAVPFITDSTNSDPAYARNRIRHRVIPELASINAAVDSAFFRLMSHVRQDDELLGKLAESALREAALSDGRKGYDVEKLLELPPPLRIRALDRAVRQTVDLHCTARQFEAMEQMLLSGGSLTLDARTQVFVSQGRFVVLKTVKIENKSEITEGIRVSPGISCMFYGRIYMPTLLSLEEYENRQKIHKNLLKNTLNYDKITGNLILRTRRPGDSFYPAGRGLKKTLKKLLNEERFPAEQRDALPVLCDDCGIVLVGGFGCDERVRITESTRRVLAFEVKGLSNSWE